jgi:Domain of unknown function (DUF5615)
VAEIRYYMDENVASAVSAALRRHGIDVVTVVDMQMRGAHDPDHLNLASQQGRVIFTHDSDFARLSSNTMQHAGIVYAPRPKSIGVIVRSQVLIHQVLSAEDMVGRIEYF